MAHYWPLRKDDTQNCEAFLIFTSQPFFFLLKLIVLVLYAVEVAIPWQAAANWCEQRLIFFFAFIAI